MRATPGSRVPVACALYALWVVGTWWFALLRLLLAFRLRLDLHQVGLHPDADVCHPINGGSGREPVLIWRNSRGGRSPTIEA